MKKVQTNCPNCGAVMTEDKCQFCGTILYDFACLDMDKPFYMKVKAGNKIIRLKTKVERFDIQHSVDNAPDLYCDDKLFSLIESEQISVHLDFVAVEDNGILYMVIDTDEIDPDTKAY